MGTNNRAPQSVNFNERFEMEGQSAAFACDNIEFCSECGSILQLPSKGDVVYCNVCGSQRDISDFADRTTVTEVYFAKRAQQKRAKTIDAQDPLVDRICPKCKHEGMTYATIQLRSADEGQTVFFTCPKCKFRESENS